MKAVPSSVVRNEFADRARAHLRVREAGVVSPWHMRFKTGSFCQLPDKSMYRRPVCNARDPCLSLDLDPVMSLPATGHLVQSYSCLIASAPPLVVQYRVVEGCQGTLIQVCALSTLLDTTQVIRSVLPHLCSSSFLGCRSVCWQSPNMGSWVDDS